MRLRDIRQLVSRLADFGHDIDGGDRVDLASGRQWRGCAGADLDGVGGQQRNGRDFGNTVGRNDPVLFHLEIDAELHACLVRDRVHFGNRPDDIALIDNRSAGAKPGNILEECVVTVRRPDLSTNHHDNRDDERETADDK